MEDLGLRNRSLLEENLDYMIAGPKVYPAIYSGRGATVTDIDGKVYLDFEGGPGVCNVGHCHPQVVAAIRRQSEILMQGPGKYLSPMAPSLAKRLSALTEGKLKKVFFASSGSEANDGAIKLAIKHSLKSGKQGLGIVAFEHGFHGRNALPLSLTGMPNYKMGMGPYASFPGVIHVQAPYAYRCPYGSATAQEAGDRAAQALRTAIQWRAPGEVSIMIAEPILGVSGVIVPPDNYWPQVAEICHENDITLIMDEIFVGFGRTGKVFAYQHWGITPDIVSFAKAVGGGLPLGGFIAKDDVASAFDPVDHNTTFGSNNMVGLAAGHAVLDVLEAERLAERAQVLGARFMDAFRAAQHRYGFIGEVRGMGLAIGVEIVRNRDTKEPSVLIGKQLQANLRNNGLIVGLSGVHDNTLRLSPPLTLTDDEADHAIELFERAFASAD